MDGRSGAPELRILWHMRICPLFLFCVERFGEKERGREGGKEGARAGVPVWLWGAPSAPFVNTWSIHLHKKSHFRFILNPFSVYSGRATVRAFKEICDCSVAAKVVGQILDP